MNEEKREWKTRRRESEREEEESNGENGMSSRGSENATLLSLISHDG